jgi:hypothetical protein
MLFSSSLDLLVLDVVYSHLPTSSRLYAVVVPKRISRIKSLKINYLSPQTAFSPFCELAKFGHLAK